jgi:four helix bundle protein
MEENNNSIKTLSNEKDLLIYKKYTNLYYYVYKILEKYPKAERFGLVSDIKNSMNSVIRYMFYAQKVSQSKKLDYLNKIDAELLYQRFAIRLSFNKKYISPNNYTTWSTRIAEVGKMLGGWIKSCLKE